MRGCFFRLTIAEVVRMRGVGKSLRHGAAIGRALPIGLGLAAALVLPLHAQLDETRDSSTYNGRITLSAPVLDNGSLYNLIPLAGTAGKTWQIDMVSNDFDALLILADPNSQVVGRSDHANGGHNARIVLTLPLTGVYWLYATTANPGATGTYTVRLLVRDNP